MAGSGPGGFVGGWNSGSGIIDRSRQRKADFLTAHPEWHIEYAREIDAYEAYKGSTDTKLELMHGKSLGPLMDRLEALYPDES